VNYTESISPNGYPIISYNISLLNADNSFNKTIIDNNSPNLGYIWNSIGSPDNQYKIKVESCDNNTLCAFGLSEIFITDNTPPNVTILSPQAINYTGSTISIEISSNEPTTWLYSLNGGSNISFFPNITITGITGNNTLIIYATDSMGNTESFTINFFIIEVIRPIDNIGIFSSIALLILGAGVILFILEGLFTSGVDIKRMITVIIGAIIVVALILSLI
jgi:hypothetical protein